jgi:hypothetical protein
MWTRQYDAIQQNLLFQQGVPTYIDELLPPVITLQSWLADKTQDFLEFCKREEEREKAEAEAEAKRLRALQPPVYDPNMPAPSPPREPQPLYT